MMRRWTLLLPALSLLGLAACGEPAPTTPDCDLDVENLTGEWISMKGGGTGADVPDKFARVKFFSEEGKKKAIYTAGQIAPGNPATEKYTYEYIEKTSQGDVLYSINMFPDKAKQRIERLKKDNRRLDVKFEGRLYVKVDAKRCALTVSDMYVTYVKGEETMDSNPSGVRTYLRSNPNEPALSFVNCDEKRQLFPFSVELPDWEKDQPLDTKSGVYKAEPVYLHYVERNFPEDEIEKKMLEYGLKSEEGCKYDFEIWSQDTKWHDSTEVTPDEKGDIRWYKQVTFDKAPVDGMFVEMHRYKTCADGKRKLLSNACNVISPEPARTAEEKEAAAAEKK